MKDNGCEMDLDQSGCSSVLSLTTLPQESGKTPVEMSQLMSLAAELDSLRREGALCDVTVTVDDKPFHAHKVSIDSVIIRITNSFGNIFTTCC